MENNTLQFKTNINCSNCVRSVSGFLNEVEGIIHWEVETDDPDKILSVSGTATRDSVMTAVQEAGFRIVAKENA